MIQSEVSGVMFTIDPVANDKRKIIIESVWGLGELIVQGEVNPDHYEVNKENFTIADKQLSAQTRQLVKIGKATKQIPVARGYQKIQKLDDKYIKELARLGKKIENHYGFPDKGRNYGRRSRKILKKTHFYRPTSYFRRFTGFTWDCGWDPKSTFKLKRD